MKKIHKRLLIALASLVVVVCGAFGILYMNGFSGMQPITNPKENQIRVACVGDSITYGHGITNWKKNNYPAVLQQLLGEKYHVANFGSSGACVNPEGDQPYVGREIYQEALAYEADIIIFMMGTNDAKPENWTNADDFIEDYMSLLGSFQKGDKSPKVYLALCAEAYYTEGADKSTGMAKYDIQPKVVDEIAQVNIVVNSNELALIS